jgi:AAA ATPase-like protein
MSTRRRRLRYSRRTTLNRIGRENCTGESGRSRTLLASFDRVVTSGRPALVLVSSYSGIGKSAVVNELHKALVPSRGLFASGKFDQYKRDIPICHAGASLSEPRPPAAGQERGRAPKLARATSAGAGPERVAHCRPRPRIETHSRPAAAGSGSSTARRSEPVPAGLPALHRRIRAAGTPARGVPRRLQRLDAATLDKAVEMKVNFYAAHLKGLA